MKHLYYLLILSGVLFILFTSLPSTARRALIPWNTNDSIIIFDTTYLESIDTREEDTIVASSTDSTPLDSIYNGKFGKLVTYQVKSKHIDQLVIKKIAIIQNDSTNYDTISLSFDTIKHIRISHSSKNRLVQFNTTQKIVIDTFSDDYYGVVTCDKAYEAARDYYEWHPRISIFKKSTNSLVIECKASLLYFDSELIRHEDINFDGRKDFALGYEHIRGGTGLVDRLEYHVYLATPNNQFEYSKSFSEISSHYKLDAKKKEIHAHDDAGTDWRYRVVNGKPVLVYERDYPLRGYGEVIVGSERHINPFTGKETQYKIEYESPYEKRYELVKNPKTGKEESQLVSPTLRDDQYFVEFRIKKSGKKLLLFQDSEYGGLRCFILTSDNTVELSYSDEFTYTQSELEESLSFKVADSKYSLFHKLSSGQKGLRVQTRDTNYTLALESKECPQTNVPYILPDITNKER